MVEWSVFKRPTKINIRGIFTTVKVVCTFLIEVSTQVPFAKKRRVIPGVMHNVRYRTLTFQYL